jgi:hypothetical protein
VDPADVAPAEPPPALLGLAIVAHHEPGTFAVTDGVESAGRSAAPRTGAHRINQGSTQMTKINATTARWSLRVDSSNGITDFVGPIDQRIGTTERVPLCYGGDVVMTINNFGSGLTWSDGID